MFQNKLPGLEAKLNDSTSASTIYCMQYTVLLTSLTTNTLRDDDWS